MNKLEDWMIDRPILAGVFAFLFSSLCWFVMWRTGQHANLLDWFVGSAGLAVAIGVGAARRKRHRHNPN